MKSKVDIGREKQIQIARDTTYYETHRETECEYGMPVWRFRRQHLLEIRRV
jgi:hypothetical protein